jgi:hypothetical protein
VATDPDDLERRLAALGGRRRKRQHERAEAARSHHDQHAAKVATMNALALASYAAGEHRGEPDFDPADKPVGTRHVAVTIDDATWAQRIVDASRAWAIWPGFDVLLEAPVADPGEGSEAGRLIFLKAADVDTSVAIIARAVRIARKELGKADGRNHGETELGLWTYFRQLYRFLNFSGWRPPCTPTPAVKQRDARRSTRLRDRSGRLALDVKEQIVSVDDADFPIGIEAARTLKILLEAHMRGDGTSWTVSKSLKKKPDSSERPDRILDRLPPEVRAFVEAKRSAGYRLKLE